MVAVINKNWKILLLQEIKSCLEFITKNSYFQVRSKIFRQVIGIPMGSNRKTILCWSYWKGKHFGHLHYFLDLHFYINQGHIQTFLYDKRISYNFNVMIFQYKCSITPSKVFFPTIIAEILQTCQATSSAVGFI